MTILIEGLNKIRDLLNTNITKGQNGTGTGSSNEEDTGLESPDSTTLKTLTNSISDRMLVTTHTLLTTEANGLSLTEFENQFSSGESMIRIRHTPITKDSTKELRFITTYEIDSG